MALPGRTAAAAAGAAVPQASYRPVLTLLASLFFMWGFITVINNTLLPHLRSVFDLSYTQTTLIESVWFIAYFFASIPSAKLIERVGYQRAMVIGLDQDPHAIEDDLRLLVTPDAHGADDDDVVAGLHQCLALLPDPPVDWVSLARGYGVDACRVTELGAFVSALRGGLARPGPFLIEVAL